MPFENTIRRVHDELIATFDRLDTYFDFPLKVREYRPWVDAWTIDEILEHITLTNHFLLITLQKSLKKVLKRVQSKPIIAQESDLERIVQIGDPDAFIWLRPKHMEPTRQISSHDVRYKLRQQKDECLWILNQIRRGEGSLHQVRMSVQNLGRLDMYEWLYFLIQHARRHSIEINRIYETSYPQIPQLRD